MKTLLFLLLPQLTFAASLITCETVERYSDQRVESSFQVPIEDGMAFKQLPSQRDPSIRFTAYYNQSMDVLGARVHDDHTGTQSGNYVEPSHEKAAVKVRYIKTKPETQLFAIDCTMK